MSEARIKRLENEVALLRQTVVDLCSKLNVGRGNLADLELERAGMRAGTTGDFSMLKDVLRRRIAERRAVANG